VAALLAAGAEVRRDGSGITLTAADGRAMHLTPTGLRSLPPALGERLARMAGDMSAPAPIAPPFREANDTNDTNGKGSEGREWERGPGRTRDKPPCRWPEALPEAPAAPTGFLGPPRGSSLACNLCGWARRS
jgi:hypothetical protein